MSAQTLDQPDDVTDRRPRHRAPGRDCGLWAAVLSANASLSRFGKEHVSSKEWRHLSQCWDTWVGLGCSFLPPSIALCYPLSGQLTRSRLSWPPGTQSYGPITPCAARQARSAALQSLTACRVLESSIDVLRERYWTELRHSWSVLGALLCRSPHFFRHHSRLPHSCFLLVQRAIASLRLCCPSAQDGRADSPYWLISRLCLAGDPWRGRGRPTRWYF